MNRRNLSYPGAVKLLKSFYPNDRVYKLKDELASPAELRYMDFLYLFEKYENAPNDPYRAIRESYDHERHKKIARRLGIYPLPIWFINRKEGAACEQGSS